MTQDTLPILEDGNLRLRAACMEDVEARLALGTVPEIQHMLGAHPDDCKEITPEQAEKWVTARIDRPNCWVIEHENRLIGEAYFHSTNTQDRRATLALGILDPTKLGQGIGTRVLHLLMAQAFGPMKLHRVALRVISYNARAIATYKKIGFTIEGRERQSARVGDAWHDDIVMGLLAHEWKVAA